MGLTSIGNKKVVLTDAKIGKNYLDGDELTLSTFFASSFFFLSNRARSGDRL
jgi:hypothetical protein